jgi:hypothetical protein
MISPDQTTFRRIQSDNPTSVQVFLSLDGQLADGSPIAGPWQGFYIPLTPEEQQMALAIVARARVLFAAQINAEPVTP